MEEDQIKEMVSNASTFLEKYYQTKLNESITKGETSLYIDYKKLIRFDPDLGDKLLDEPEDCIKIFEIALKNIISTSADKKDTKIRFYNAEKSCKVEINKIRVKHINKLISIEGMIRQKSDVTGKVTSSIFECPSCGNRITILQLEEGKFLEPKSCSCGRKGKFKLVDKERDNMYTLSVEEPTTMIQGGTKLAKVKILCIGDLSDPSIERSVYQGAKVEITGVLKEVLQVNRRSVVTSVIHWYIDANNIKVHDESFSNIKWDEKDKKKFGVLSNKKNWLKLLRQSIFYDVHSYDEECEAIILQMFGGVGKEREGANVRGNMHLLLVGDPGTSKSTMLKVASQFAPKAMYVAGKGASGVGLTASVVRDELIGGYVLEAGALVLTNNGLLCLDELDKVDDDDKISLHEPLSEGSLSINKANIQATLIANTAVLAAANPKFSSFSDYTSIYSQVDLSSTLINRFDLVYPIKESNLSSDDDRSIAKKILNRAGKDIIKPPYSKEFVKKYISFAKTINPVITDEIIDMVADKYVELKNIKKMALSKGDDVIPISARNVDGFRRIIEAVARSRLHEVVTKDDFRVAYNKMVYSIQQVGIDPESGDLVEHFDSGKVFKKKDLLARTLRLIRDRTKDHNEMISYDELCSILKDEGIDDVLKIDEIISILKRNGEIFEPINRNYKSAS